jgi:putative ABC transport system substrate-binding protein
MGHPRRRRFLIASSALLAAPFIVEAQPTKKSYRIGFLLGLHGRKGGTAPFEQGLRELGWVNGQNVTIEYRSAEGHFDRLPALATELVDSDVDVIVALSAPETAAAKRATQTVPIAFCVHGDPVGTGDVASLAHPGGNVTGLTQVHPELIGKQLQILKEVAPRATQVAVLWNGANPAKALDWRDLRVAAPRLGFVLQSHAVRVPGDFNGAFTAITKEHPDALMVLADPLTVQLRDSIVEFAAKEQIVGMYPLALFAEAGGLIACGADINDLLHRCAGYVDKILKGAKPADLPVEEATKFELVINLKTAKALGVTIPPSLLLEADRVIE